MTAGRRRRRRREVDDQGPRWTKYQHDDAEVAGCTVLNRAAHLGSCRFRIRLTSSHGARESDHSSLALHGNHAALHVRQNQLHSQQMM